MKVSLRERYKQADLEGMALRQVYRNAESYLITLSDEAVGVTRKIENGDIAGLSGCIRADMPAYSHFFRKLESAHIQRSRCNYADYWQSLSGVKCIIPIKKGARNHQLHTRTNAHSSSD